MKIIYEPGDKIIHNKMEQVHTVVASNDFCVYVDEQVNGVNKAIPLNEVSPFIDIYVVSHNKEIYSVMGSTSDAIDYTKIYNAAEHFNQNIHFCILTFINSTEEAIADIEDINCYSKDQE